MTIAKPVKFLRNDKFPNSYILRCSIANCQFVSEVRRTKTQPLIECMGRGAGRVSGQLNEVAAARETLRNGPFEHLLSDARPALRIGHGKLEIYQLGQHQITRVPGSPWLLPRSQAEAGMKNILNGLECRLADLG